MNRLLYKSIFVLLIGLLAACANSTPPATPTSEPKEPLQFTEYKNEVGFDMLYPSDWTYNIVRQGIIAFAAPEDLTIDEDNPAASVVVLRDAGDAGKTVQEQFDHYVSSGPLSTGYEVIHEAEQIEISGLEVWRVTVRNSAEIPLTSHILFTETDLGFNYVFAATAPTEEWNDWWPSYQVMMDSISINE